jgi:ubiquinone/menaquinone biosynthesis C-methylase UbiE
MAEVNPDTALLTVMDDTMSAIKFQAIRCAALLELADLVKDEPQSVSNLAAATSTDERALTTLLQALGACGYFREVDPGIFGQSELSYILRKDIPHSQHALALLNGEDWIWLTLRQSLLSIQTGKEVFTEIFGKDTWRYMQEDNPEAGQRFNLAMRSASAQGDQAIAHAYDFSTVQTIVDIGGGVGSLLAAILQTHPNANGILFDRSSVIAEASQLPHIQALQDRFTLASGDFFTAVPADANIYLIKHVIHDWEDPECIRLLTNVAQVMKPDGHVLIIDEIVVPGQPTPPLVALLNLQLHLLMTGRKRTVDEHVPMLTAARLELKNVYPTASQLSILEAVKRR